MHFLDLQSSHAVVTSIALGVNSLVQKNPNGIDITIAEVATELGCTDLSTFKGLPHFVAVHTERTKLGYNNPSKMAGQDVGRALRYVLDLHFNYTKIENRGFKSQYRLHGLK